MTHFLLNAFALVWPTTKVAVNTIYHSSKYPSSIVIPFVPEQESALPAPEFIDVPPVSRRSPTLMYSRPSRRIERDIGLNPEESTVTVYFEKDEKHILSSKTTLELCRHFKAVASNLDPAATQASGEVSYNIEGHKLGTVNVKVNTTTTAKTFCEVINITVNGLLVLSKKWTKP